MATMRGSSPDKRGLDVQYALRRPVILTAMLVEKVPSALITSVMAMPRSLASTGAFTRLTLSGKWRARSSFKRTGVRARGLLLGHGAAVVDLHAPCPRPRMEAKAPDGRRTV